MKKVLLLGLALSSPFLAFADGAAVPDATSQITAINSSLSGYGTLMFGIALVATGVMVGVKWIKRAKGAA